MNKALSELSGVDCDWLS